MNSPNASLVLDSGTTNLDDVPSGFLPTPLESLDFMTLARRRTFWLDPPPPVDTALPEPAVDLKHYPRPPQPPKYNCYSVGYFFVYFLYTLTKALTHRSAEPAAAC